MTQINLTGQIISDSFNFICSNFHVNVTCIFHKLKNFNFWEGLISLMAFLSLRHIDGVQHVFTCSGSAVYFQNEEENKK
jgi:hypothetical protein